MGNLPTNCLSVFDHFVGLVLKGLMEVASEHFINSFVTNVAIFYPLKTPDNPRFSGIVRGYKMGKSAGNGSNI